MRNWMSQNQLLSSFSLLFGVNDAINQRRNCPPHLSKFVTSRALQCRLCSTMLCEADCVKCQNRSLFSAAMAVCAFGCLRSTFACWWRQVVVHVGA